MCPLPGISQDAAITGWALIGPLRKPPVSQPRIKFELTPWVRELGHCAQLLPPVIVLQPLNIGFVEMHAVLHLDEHQICGP